MVQTFKCKEMILWKLPGEEKRKRGRIILQSQWRKGLSVIQNLESIKEIINNKKHLYMAKNSILNIKA